MDDDQQTEAEELISRAPTQEDFVRLCARLNELGARYIVIGGLAIISAGYAGSTMDLDCVTDTSSENEPPDSLFRWQHDGGNIIDGD
jgi:hypothetical protein